MTNDREQTPDSGAWTTGSGEPAPETDETALAGARRGMPGQDAGPETSEHGTDQESNVPGRSKPASEPAETAPPNTVPGAPDQEQA